MSLELGNQTNLSHDEKVDEDDFYNAKQTEIRPSKSLEANQGEDSLIAECYVGFQKLLSSELRNMDRKDFEVFTNQIRKQSSVDGSATPQTPKAFK